MADEKTRIESEYDFTAKGLDGLITKVGKLTKSLTQTATAVEKVLDNFDELSKKDISKVTYNNQVNSNQTQIKAGRNSVTYVHGSENSRDTTEKLRDKIDEQLQIQLEILKKQNDNLVNEQINETKKAEAYYTMAQTASSRAPSKNAYEEALVKQKKYNEPYMQLKHDHPEWFVSDKYNPKIQAANAIQGIGGIVSKYGTGGRIIGDMISVLGSGLTSPATMAASAVTKLGKAIGDFVSTAVQSYSEIEAIKTNLNVVYGSQVQSDAAFNEIAQYAVKSPFGVQETSEMAILLKQSGVYASDLMDTLKMIGDTAGGNMEKMKRIANNYAQIQAIGKASMLDMRQFAYAGIPIFEAVSKELGVSQQQLRKLISGGKITSDIIEKVFKDLTGVNGVFENATEKGAATLKARLQNLKDSRQLAMASIGEGIVNKGEVTGGDSFVISNLGLVENIYTGLNKWVSGKNIEHDINVIANRNEKIQELQTLIDYNEKNGNKEMVKMLQEELNKILASKSLDMERATFYNSYLNKNSMYEDMISSGFLSTNPYSLNGYYADVENLKIQLKNLQNDYETVLNDYTSSSAYKNFTKSQRYDTADALSVEMNKVSEALQELEKHLSITTEELIANYETLAINSQQSIFDDSSKMAQASGSAYNTAAEIKDAIENSDEGKRKTEELQKKKWNETIELMKQMQKSLDKNGVVDFSKLSYEDFIKYFNTGAIEAGKKLTVANTENKKLLEEDVPILKKQFAIVQSNIEQQLEGDLKTAFRNAYGVLGRTKDSISSEEFLRQYQIVMEKQIKLLNGNDNLLNYLNSASIQWEGDLTDFNVNINDLLSGSGNVFIPLWKRILGGATGISPNVISSTRETLGWYADDVAIRNRTSGTLSAMLNEGAGVSAVQRLLKTSGIGAELRGDTGAVYQIDWKATQKAIKEFSLQLSSSTDVIKAYKSGLEEELNTYKTLLSEGLTSSETQDLKNAKTISAKKLNKLQKVYGDQLVNAFGEIMQVNGVKVSFKDGKFIDERGFIYQQDQVELTGNIFKVIEEKLPQIYDELVAAEKANQNNTVLNKLFSDTNSTYLTSQMFRDSSLSANAMNMILNNPEYITSNLETMLKTRIANNSFGFTNTNDVLQAASINGGKKGDAARQWIQEYLDEIAKSAETLVNNPYYKKLVEDNKNLERTQELNKTIAWLGDYQNMTPMFGWNSNDTSSYHKNGEEGIRQRLFGGDVMKLAGISDSSTLEQITDALMGVTDETRETVRATAEWKKNLQDVGRIIGKEAIVQSLKNMAQSLGDIAKNTAKQTFLAPFEAMGEALIDADSASESFSNNLKQIGASMLQNMGSVMATAGFNIAASAAVESNWAMVAAGLGLAAAGGVASGLGGAVNNASKSKDKSKSEIEKLESLKDRLEELLEQARKDALYYENNLRHQTALDINRQVSQTSVHDALIDTNGKVITTDPKDYLIATKNPRSLVGGNYTFQPVINNIVHNNAGVQVRQEQTVNPDGSIDFETYIDSKIEEFIVSSKSDDAFNYRNARLSGRRSVM